MKVSFYFFLLFFIFSSCSQKNESLKKAYKLPKKLKEVSGIAFSKQLTWVIEDSGNKNHIYGLNAKGAIEREITVSSRKNIDWEDLATDNSDNLYIGDFGNNANIRKDLAIYILNNNEFEKEKKTSKKITFNYPEQKEFPPKKTNLLFDCEAFFEWKNHFYLFTKNRSKDFDGTTLIYRITNQEGNQKATLLTRFKTCNNSKNCTITSASISPNGKKVVLLSYDAVWLFENFKADDFTNGTMTKLELNHVSQKEAICFKDENTLLIADEKNKKNGGNVYEVKLNDLKLKS